jgi:hypothetical protein
MIMPSSKKIRNPFAALAKKRRAGKHRPKKGKRNSGKNEQREILKDAD